MKNEENVLLDALLSVIKNDQDYSDDDMLLFKNIVAVSDDTKAPNKHFVRISTDDVNLDFICTNLWKNNCTVVETEFEEWPLDFSKY